MDRQDLKEGQEVYVKGRVIYTGDHLDIVLDKGSFIENAIILHHEKPVIPQFVADWIEEGKKICRDVQDLFEFDFNSEEVKRWFLNYKPFDLIARAWLDGYEVEKEKRYKIYKNPLVRLCLMIRGACVLCIKSTLTIQDFFLLNQN